MERRALLLSLALVPWVATAQGIASAEKHASKWFMNARDTFLKRTEGLQATDLDAFEAASKKPLGGASRRDLFLVLPSFNPLFDTGNKLISGAVPKYAKRLEQLPKDAISRWHAAMGGSVLSAALSLTAENTLFPSEIFNEKAFHSFTSSFK